MSRIAKSCLIVAALFCVLKLTYSIPTSYYVGVGIADMTGPAADVDMMGYGKPGQTAHGIHMRQFSRAFIIVDPDTQRRVVYVNTDTFMVSQAVKLESIRRAHANLQPANIYVNTGKLFNSSINRSPSAYLKNPESERKQYAYDVDKTMTVLKFVDADNKPIGMLSWFPVHGNSMNNTNRLISGDNKGYASYLFEKLMNKGALPGQGAFVAAFAQGSEGDVSPNTKGPHCIDTGHSCDNVHSTCHGRNEFCVASGPGKDMFESTKIIGKNQFNKALVKTCKPALGYSFAAGTTDGPGAFDFKQGTNSSSLVWNFVRNFVHKPTKEQIECHHPKPILLNTGETTQPFAWQPTIVDTQILRIGRLIIVPVPAEFTTMSGRRMQNAVENALVKEGFPDKPLTVIAGLANDYASFVTTFEEYQAQRFEGASTIYGPHTLQAFIQVYSNLSTAIAKGDTVSVTFYGVNPRLRTRIIGDYDEETFLDVWRWAENETYIYGRVYNEGDWQTKCKFIHYGNSKIYVSHHGLQGNRREISPWGYSLYEAGHIFRVDLRRDCI